MENSEIWKFKQFDICQDGATMKVNTDAILLGAWAHVDGKLLSLDIGSGTGIIAMMIAQRNPEIVSVGIDIDSDSALCTSKNMLGSPFASRLRSEEVSIQDFAGLNKDKYDLIVSNPPFFSGGTFSANENKNNVRHTVKLSHSDLLLSVKKLLVPDGHFDLILPYIEGLRLIELALQYDLYLHHLTEITARPGKPVERLLISLTNRKTADPSKDSLTVYGLEGSEYSDDYKALTSAFYLGM